ncbi:MAG: hypothetical protein OQK82_02625 [Candidatus Pacearchaeota archaeon]|nr:hypothetical protein [Candidatus Pacearchaeota archaeon]
MDKESNLENFKKDYEILKEKYSLPDFDEFNREFNIEKLADMETDYLIREIRKVITDKFASYVRFVEVFLHTANAPMFIFSLMKIISVEDKKILGKIYERLAKSEIRVVTLDLNFSEESEVEFVKSAYLMWKEVKSDLLKFVKKLEDNWDVKPEVNGKNYFG